MAQGQAQRFSDDDLRAIVADPRFTPADLELLSPMERQRVEQIQSEGTLKGRMAGGLNTALDAFLVGPAKGLGESVFRLGSAVNETPVLGDLTGALAKLVGPEGTDPDAAFAKVPKELEASNTAQAVGKGAEQIGEFFIPAGPSRLAAVKALVSRIPNASSPQTMALLNKIAAYLGRAGGEAASATGVSALHGDVEPERAGLMAAMGSVLGGAAGAAQPAVARTLTALGKSPTARTVIPPIAAAPIAGAVGGATGLGGGLGAYGAATALIRKLLSTAGKPNTFSPKNVNLMRRTMENTGHVGGKVAAGAVDQRRASTRRRRLEEE